MFLAQKAVFSSVLQEEFGDKALAALLPLFW